MNKFIKCESCSTRLDSLFCHLTKQDVVSIDAYKTTNRYKRGTVLFTENSPSTGLFCITQGKVKLVKSGINGKEALLRILGPGDLLGIIGILTDEPYSVTAQTMEESVICFIQKPFFKNLLHTNADLAMGVMQKLSVELSESENKLSDMTNKNVSIRLAQLLVSLGEKHGLSKPFGLLLDIPVTRVEIAAMIGTSPESVIRTLSKFEELGYLGLQGKKIFLKNIENLKNFESDYPN